nr:putative RIN4, pathogenic type III effector avirulence factor Avr cleavage [Ipomoea batatas]
MSVPKFGAWEAKPGSSPSNYTVMFSEARANRKQHKTEYTHHSIGNDQELREEEGGHSLGLSLWVLLGLHFQSPGNTLKHLSLYFLHSCTFSVPAEVKLENKRKLDYHIVSTQDSIKCILAQGLKARVCEMS